MRCMEAKPRPVDFESCSRKGMAQVALKDFPGGGSFSVVGLAFLLFVVLLWGLGLSWVGRCAESWAGGCGLVSASASALMAAAVGFLTNASDSVPSSIRLSVSINGLD